ncbi:MAG: hypothetical protein HYX75_25530 [Acidobacteria bacterium]|nr:hypothetical protein [Acidobacteriota bacterium]
MKERRPWGRLGLGLAVILIVVLAGFLRNRAVRLLPVDFDELTYLPAAFRYEEMLARGSWGQVAAFDDNLEHPPLNKLLFAADLWVRNPKEPQWDALEVGRAIPLADQAAFLGPRRISAVGGALQVLLMTLVHPLAGLLLALDTYHIKYCAQVYLEGVPGLMAVLAVFLFERALVADGPKPNSSQPLRLRWSLLIPSAATLGLAAAGKYPYGIVGVVLLAFLLCRARSLRTVLLYSAAALLFFLLADPFLWPNPPGKLWESLTFHVRYSQSEHVVSSGMPWYSPFAHLLRAAPTKWHPGVFYTGLADLIILPLSLLGVPRALRERPVWVAWAGFGLLFLTLWPTKWPQYILLVLPPLTVCAGIGIEQIGLAVWTKMRRRA